MKYMKHGGEGLSALGLHILYKVESIKYMKHGGEGLSALGAAAFGATVYSGVRTLLACLIAPAAARATCSHACAVQCIKLYTLYFILYIAHTPAQHSADVQRSTAQQGTVWCRTYACRAVSEEASCSTSDL